MLLLTAFFVAPAAARLFHSLPEDPFAFPKYKVDFLSHLPLPPDTAKRWLAQGLRGGVREFLDQPWDDTWHRPTLDGDEQVSFGVAGEDASLPPQPPDVHDDYTLEHMKMGADEYLCLTPKPLEPPPPDEADDEEELTPAHSWSLLHPLSGTCLYHRQQWFTYSYCHNAEIRQFRELIKARSLTSGPHQPEEDPNWEAYTLGRAPAAPEPGADLTVAQQDALAANLELARSAGSRYLVQRWGDGTMCDKTGKPREVEVQFHCSMATTDTVAFVKEAKTCSYVLVVHTPRLCAEPGFMSNKDAAEQASISCREIVTAEPTDHSDAAFLPDSDHPHKYPRRKPVLPLPQAKPKDGTAAAADGTKGKYTDVLRKALDAIKGMQWQSGELEMEMLDDGDGNFIIQFIDDVPFDAVNDALGREVPDKAADDRSEAGVDIKGAKNTKAGDEEQDDNDAADRRREIDELAT
ncbi:hypothetical protein GGX14DRAFT_590577 [Mycena pura]|uniref:Protein OS-9 homolog n=1 Tax=Mycena pura TaxID=153505 RepID=A0AAD6YJI6_9AGAR|nr:hypothetical protein GGX14DRAFT_590577 [Mycena pura]